MLRTKRIPGSDSQNQKPRVPAIAKVEVAWADRDADNERDAVRVEARLMACVDLDDSSFVGLTENLSASGVFVATRTPQKIGTMVRLLIALPDLALVRAEGTVRWLRHPSPGHACSAGMGIRFESLSPLDAVRIHEFVRARQSGMFGEADGAHRRSA